MAELKPRYSVVVFDLDGTLLPGMSISLLLADSLGHREIVEDLDQRMQRYELSVREASDAEAKLFRGINVTDVQRVLRSVPWIDGLGETLHVLAHAGCELLLATLAWSCASEMLGARYPFSAVSGTKLGVEDGKFTGSVSCYCDELDKLDFVEQWCFRHDHELSDVAAIGDSRSDVALFERAGFSIGLNATTEARNVAHVTLDTNDLRDVLPLLISYPPENTPDPFVA